MLKVFADRQFDGVWTQERRVVARQFPPNALKIGSRAFLGLVKRKNRATIGRKGIVSRAKRLVMLTPLVIAKPRNPCPDAAGSSPIADKASWREFRPMRLTTNLALRAGRSRVEFRVSD
jgi:hypothetical protein